MMNIEEQISAFMDRALSPQEETELLHVLAVSPDKRDLFRSYNNLKYAAMNDVRSTNVPPHVDQNILSGIAAIEAAAVSTIRSGTTSGIFTSSKVLWYALGSLMLLTIGYFAHDFFSQKFSSSAESGEQLPQLTNHVDISAIASVNGTRLPSNNDKGGIGKDRIVYRSVQKPVYITKSDTIFREGQHIIRTDTLFVPGPPIQVVTEKLSDVSENRTIDPNLFSATPKYNFLEQIDITLEREHLQTYPYIDYAKLNVTRMNQLLSIEAAYRFNQYHAVGIAFGEKIFSQDFYKVENDSIYIFQQQPTFTYGGAFYRFSYPIFHGIMPQAYIQVGSTKVGPVLGAKVAVAVSPINHIHVLFGANSSLLIYKLNQNIFTSYTLGLFYGLQYQF